MHWFGLFEWPRIGFVTALSAAAKEGWRDTFGAAHEAAGYALLALHDRAELRGPSEVARGPVALLGDAAHPMRPYLSQGAGMALEDAYPRSAGRTLRIEHGGGGAVRAVCRTPLGAHHARGLPRWGRNAAMKLLGERLLADRWLYRGPPLPPALP